MVAFFVRRLVGGLVTLFLGTFILHSLVLYTPGGARDQFDAWLHPEGKPALTSLAWRINREYRFDIDWPGDYFAWLFNDIEDSHLRGVPDPAVRNIDIKIGGIEIQGSGILTGDFGQSIIHRKDVPALELYGIRLIPTFSVPFNTILLFMLIAVLQRRRPHPYRSSRIPPNARWRPAELWTTS